MKKSFVSLLLISVILFCSCSAKPKEYTSDEAKEISVYITKTGEKYHKKSCDYLKYSKYEITLKEAIELKYDACLVCTPPIISE